MRKARLPRKALLFVAGLLLCGLAGCKSKDPAKADACQKTATASLDACQDCCKGAGFSGYSWTSDTCRCM